MQTWKISQEWLKADLDNLDEQELVFKFVDERDDGFIDKEEFKTFITIIGLESDEHMNSLIMAAFDKDGDGKISFEGDWFFYSHSFELS